MITFQQARERAEVEWPKSGYGNYFPSAEPFRAAAAGFEDSAGYRIDPAEPVLDNDGLSVMDFPVIFVSKSTGEVTFEPIIMNFGRIEKMIAVGNTDPPWPLRPASTVRRHKAGRTSCGQT